MNYCVVRCVAPKRFVTTIGCFPGHQALYKKTKAVYNHYLIVIKSRSFLLNLFFSEMEA